MSLSFREQAAIAYSVRNDEDGWLLDDADSVALAQSLADACCKAWGHVFTNVMPHEIGAATIATPDYRDWPRHSECRRCGAKEEKP